MIELAAYVLLAVSLSLEGLSRAIAHRRGVKRIGSFAVSVPSVLVGTFFLAVVVVSVLELALSPIASPTTSSLLAASLLFLAGWIIRYPVMVNPPWIPGGSLRARFFDRVRALRWRDGPLHVRHPRYLGLWFEAIALALIAFAPAGLILALGMPVLLQRAIKVEEEQTAKRTDKHEDEVRSEQSFTPRAFFSLPVAVATLLGVGVPSLIVAFGTRDLEIFVSDSDTGRTLMLALAGGQGTLGIFIISSLLIGVHFLAATYSWRVSQLLLTNWRLVAAFALVSLSIGFDLLVVARTTDWLIDERLAGALVDEGMFLALLAIVFLVAAAMTLMRLMSAEFLMSRLLQPLGERWLRWVSAEWTQEEHQVTAPNDPLLSVTEFFRALIQRRDVAGFRAARSALALHLRDLWTGGRRNGGDHHVALDTYLHWHMRPLIREAARDPDPDFIEAVARLVLFLYQDQHPYVVPGERLGLLMSGQQPFGERLLREVLEASLEYGKIKTAGEALTFVSIGGQRLIPKLPREEEVSGRFNPNYDYSKERSEEEKKAERRNDAKVEVIQHSYIGYITDVGKRAVTARHAELVQSALIDLSSVVREALDSDLSPAIRSRVAYIALGGFSSIVDVVAKERLSGTVWLSVFDWMITGDLDPTNTEHMDIAKRVINTVTATLRKLRLANLLDELSIEGALMSAIAVIEKQPELAEPLIMELGEVLRSPDGLDDQEGVRIADAASRALKTIAVRSEIASAPAMKELANKLLADNHED